MNIKEALERGSLQRIRPARDLMEKELAEAEYDLQKAEQTLQDGDFKWSTVQSYYVMFHSARALLFSIGYREKSHAAILAVLEGQCLKGKLEESYLDDYRAGMNARENADYHHTYSPETANHLLKAAREFKGEMENQV